MGVEGLESVRLEHGVMFAGGGKLKSPVSRGLEIAWEFSCCPCYRKTKENKIEMPPAKGFTFAG